MEATMKKFTAILVAIVLMMNMMAICASAANYANAQPIDITANIKAGTRKVLFVLPENSSNIYLSSRNLPEVNVITVDEINTYAIMNSCSLVLVDGVQDILASRIRR